MKKTLGGQRLGSGNRMTVDLHGFERSTHDLSYIWRSTMSAGTLVPFMNELALPGDTFDITLNCDGKTHPTVGPLFGSYKVQLDVFEIPIRLYHSGLHNNRLGIGLVMSQIKLPKFYLIPPTAKATIAEQDIDNSQINPSCIFSYLGVRGVGTIASDMTTNLGRKFNAVPWLGYWEIYKNYYANKQEEVGYVIAHVTPVVTKTVTSIQMGVTGVGFDTLQQRPAQSQIPVNENEEILINYTPGSPPNLEHILLYFWGYDNEPIRASDASYVTWNDNGNRLAGIWRYGAYGDRLAKNWDYISPESLKNDPPRLQEFSLPSIDLMRDAILQEPYIGEFLINPKGIAPYAYVLGGASIDGKWYPQTLYNQEGLGIKTYQSDLFNNWLSTEWLDGTGGINEITAVDTSDGNFKIDALILARKVYDMLNRIAVSGGSYDDWLEAVYDEESFNRAESPVYHGGLIKELVFQEVVSNSQAIDTADNTTQPLGTLAGKGIMSGKHKGGKVTIHVKEPSFIMGIASLTPRLDYSQGNKWHVNLDTLDDLHKPSLDQIGFQELITEQMAWWSTKRTTTPWVWETKSAGKQPAWINYMTNVNEVRGNFAAKDNEMFMVLNRRYEAESLANGDIGIKDLTTYIDPTKFNHIFAETSLDAQNFWMQISIDMIARRKMSAKIMPNL